MRGYILPILILATSVTTTVQPLTATAQETTSSVRGSVNDETGAPIEGATVTIVHTPSGTGRSSVTGSGGAYSAFGLRPGGPYEITIEAPGYQSASMSEVFLGVGEPVALPVSLSPTAASGPVDEIVVIGSTSATELSAGPSSTFGRNDIEGISSVNRDIRDIARRDPFASFNPNSRGVSIAGQNARTNKFSVDGVRFSDNFGLQQGGLPTTRGPVPLDAVEQMSVKVAPYDISEGDFQGGSVNVVLRSGDNDFTGSAFYTFTDDSLTGDNTKGTDVDLDFESETWGGFVSGPIIRDTLFFALSYEELDETEPASYGLTGAPNVVPNLTQADLDNVSAIAQSVYGYDTMGTRTSIPETDKKFTGKIDWNINDNHRLSLTSIMQESYLQSSGTGSGSLTSPSLNFAARATNEPEEVNSHALQLNSYWTNNFSTETRLNYRDYSKVPSSLGAAGFGQFEICLDDTSTGDIFRCSQDGTPRLYFGTEQYSQADVVKQKQYGIELVGRLELNDHSIKAQAAYNALEITNVFVHSSLGVYYFDSVEALQNQQASTLSWQYSITGDLNDINASFEYDQYTLGVQDSWNISNNLNLTYGLRWDLYKMDDRPPLNEFFLDRYGFPNNYNLDDNLIPQPRVNLTWWPTDRLTIRAGAGLFNGGAPDVFIGNSFSVAGVYGNTLSNITRTPTGCTLGTSSSSTPLPADVCAAALDNVTGNSFHPVLANYLQTNTDALSAAPVNAMTEDFELPSTWKASVSIDYVADFGELGDEWNLGLDLYQGWVKNAALYTDIRLSEVGTSPDGRPIYADTYTNSTNNDLLMSNTGRGTSQVIVGRVSKSWDTGISASLSYTYSDIESLSDMSSSTANGTYGAAPMVDPNMPAYGTSGYEIQENLKLSLDYQWAFFGDYMTRISLYADYRSGTPYSLTMNSSGSRSLWGTTGSSSRYLFYVPDVSSMDADPLVQYGSVEDYENLRDYVVAKGLPQGEIVDKNSRRSPDYFKVDLHIEQELPAPFTDTARFQVFADVENLLNLINEDYGSFRYYSSNASLVNVSCAVTSGSSCDQYRYSSFREPNLSTQNRIGLWSVRVGARLDF